MNHRTVVHLSPRHYKLLCWAQFAVCPLYERALGQRVYALHSTIWNLNCSIQSLTVLCIYGLLARTCNLNAPKKFWFTWSHYFCWVWVLRLSGNIKCFTYAYLLSCVNSFIVHLDLHITTIVPTELSSWTLCIIFCRFRTMKRCGFFVSIC